MQSKLGVAVIGCGLIGRRRAHEAALHHGTRVVAVADLISAVAARTAVEYGATAYTDWRGVAFLPGVDIVVVATPNGSLAEIACEALQAGKHVLLEKPMGRNFAEALAIRDAARRASRLVKVGFNHRYHPAIAEAFRRYRSGTIGDVINIRARYGHGGRPGYENEWRGDCELAGGGELTDQGVHVLDLINGFVGLADRVYCKTQSAVWPIEPLEDNAFALLTYPHALASFHTSWTQWKNLFSFEVFGTAGSLAIEGLGNSYGTERLIHAMRLLEGGVPSIEECFYDGPDQSWRLEWAEFISAIGLGAAYSGTPDEGVAVMQMLDACYRSRDVDAPVDVCAPSA